MKWRNKYFVDLALPFGLRSAPGIFNTLADLFEWILQHNYDVADILHYLDDYFTLGPAGTPTCSKSVNAIQQASRDLGLPLAPDKCKGPTTCLIFLGIELNSVSMTARLPTEKLTDLQSTISHWAQKKFCTRKQLESLVGKLSHACSVVAYGRTFLQRLINLLRSSQLRQKFIRLNKQARLDLQWWSLFLPSTYQNGPPCLILRSLLMRPAVKVSADITTTSGFPRRGYQPKNLSAWPTRNCTPSWFHVTSGATTGVTSEYSSIVTIKVSCTFLKPARPRTMLSWI